jgi:hypothetical protein
MEEHMELKGKWHYKGESSGAVVFSGVLDNNSFWNHRAIY